MADSIIGFGYDSAERKHRPASEREARWETDESLVSALQAAEEQAYEVLIARFQHPVYNLVYRLVNDPADSADVVQEVFLKVFRNINSFRKQSSLKTWIYRIALNEAYNQRRWFCRHRKQEVGLDDEQEGSRSWIESISDHARDPYELTLNEERHHLIEDALRDVNPAFRAAVILRDLEEMSYEDIADVMQVSLGTVKSRILRGREALRRVLADKVEERRGASNLGWAEGTIK